MRMYDCCRVTAPVALSHDLVAFSHDLVQQFEKISIDLAEAVNLKGIMDVEVILHDGKLKVLRLMPGSPARPPPPSIMPPASIWWNFWERFSFTSASLQVHALARFSSHSPHSPKNLEPPACIV